MKEANIKITANTGSAEQNLQQLGNTADVASQQMLGVADTAFAIAETMTGSFAIATGAIGLFAGENEKFQKIAMKANSAIAIAIGVRQIAEQRANIAILANTTLTKANTIVTRIAAATMRMFGVSVKGSVMAFKAMKAAIVSTGIGALVVALGMLIEKLMSAGDETEELARQQEELNKKIADGQSAINKQIKLQEDLRRANTQQEKDLIKMKLDYEDAKKAVEGLSAAYIEEIESNKLTGQFNQATRLQLQAQIATIEEMDLAIIAQSKLIAEESEKGKKDKVTTTQEVKKLSELQKSIILEETFLRQSLLDNIITESDLKKQMFKNEIELMEEKLDTLKLTEDEEFILREEIAIKEIALEQFKADELARIINETAQKTIEASGKVKEAKEQDEADLLEQAERDQDARMMMAQASADAIGSISNLLEEGSKEQKALALIEIAINTGLGMMGALRIAQKSAEGTGIAAALSFPIFYASQLAAVLGAAAQAKSIIKSGDSAGGAGGGGITYTAPYVPESAEQSGTPESGNTGSGAPVRAFVVSNQISNQQALDSELELQATL